MSARSGRGGKDATPFYAPAPAHKTREAVQARVLEGLRASVRSVNTSRPFTPADTSRGLFGVSTGASGGQHMQALAESPVISSSSSSMHASPLDRPTSAFPIGRKQFLASLPETDGLNRPPTAAVRLAPLPPSDARPPSSKRATSASRRVQSGSQSRSSEEEGERRGSGSGSIGDDEGLEHSSRSGSGKKLPTARSTEESIRERSSSMRERERKGRVEEDESSSSPRQRSRPSRERDHIGSHSAKETSDTRERRRGDLSAMSELSIQETPETGGDVLSPMKEDTREGATKSRRVMPTPPAQPRDQSVERPYNRKITSADQSRISSAQLEETQFLEEINTIMASLDPDLPADSLLASLTTLHGILSQKPITSGRLKGSVLRALFRLLDLKETKVLLRTIRTVLLITDKGPTLANVSKMLFKLSRDEHNDGIFREEGIAEVLVHILKVTDRQYFTESLVYASGTIKNLSNSSESQDDLVKAGAVQAFGAIVEDIMKNPPEAESTLSAHTNHLLLQMTAALRNLSVQSAHRQAFLKGNLMQGFSFLLHSYQGDQELVLNISRILSKLTLHSDCRDALQQQEGIFACLASLSMMHKASKALVIRLLFVLGNLTANEEENRHLLFAGTRQAADLFDLLQFFMGVNSQDMKPDVQKESEDCMVKLIRVIANLCISADLGPMLASYPQVDLFLALLSSKKIESSHELVLNLVGCINNMSFYQNHENRILLNRLQIAEMLCPLLMSSNMEVVIEAGRVFGNFSQFKEVRELLRRNRADELLVVLLQHENQEVVYTVCGILMNLMADQAHRTVLKTSGGVENLVDVLGNAVHSDWQLAGMACKTLWNFSEALAREGSSAAEVFGENEAHEILSLLREYMDESVAEECQPPSMMHIWEQEFLPVATYLEKRIKDRLPYLEPLEGTE